ncbi:bifunctional protein-serine/threonine kinase/phosphatase [Atopomonas sediminilitoris]|uniref:bifunctional protein-serine/threonine kinase/phosphatase n=1 Tax=Atopomonas sediminilitoris TaxID=2919919 RepID=UPI001F4DA616|nr:bifunctional protein-serine/threonine kinase/phosphatase [Atopomonas sediminilitoris]MCJ8167865.1 bifunctional protein-serine/threonine kinase/phosphatase [Atopomonas sediminilitoris]
MSLTLSIAEASATGPRSVNQDAVRMVTPPSAQAASKGYLFALADGVSGCADGGLAARASVQALASDYYATPETWAVGQALDRILVAHNRWLHAQSSQGPLLTTLTSLILRGRRFTAAHVGDSRLYRWRKQRLERLTEDHVWTQPGMEHVLKRALGLDEHLVVDYRDGELQVGDCFVLLSDGVWAALNDGILNDMLNNEQHDLPHLCQLMLQTAFKAGSNDNASAIVVRVDALPDGDLDDELAALAQWPLPGRLKTGQSFEGFAVTGIVHESRHSLLYRVLDNEQRPWLLKTLPSSHQDDQRAQQRLLLEEWFLKRLGGRNFTDISPLPSRQHLYYVMREHAGETLAERFKRQGPMSLGDAHEQLERVLRGLGSLHRLNILHRDIKPENLHLGQDGELRILDFGVAHCPGLTEDEPGSQPGTPSFIAPERFSGSEADISNDLYATGVTFYHLLTGHYPYGEIEPFQHPRFGSATPASRYRPDLPAWWVDMLDKAVAANPEQRYETAEEWLLQLERGGDIREVPSHRPLIEREPLKVWQSVALISLLLNLLLFYFLVQG